MTDEEVLDALVSTVQTGAHNVGRSFTEPDDDWMPIALIGSRNGSLVPVALTLPLGTESEKDAAAEALTRAVRKANGRAVAYVCSAWAYENADAEEYQRYLRGERPDKPTENRIEQVLITACTLRKEFMCWARIERDGVNPPRLGEWQTLGQGQGESIAGRFVDALRVALRPQG